MDNSETDKNDKSPLLKPKRPRPPPSEKQMDNFRKMSEKRAENIAKKKEDKIIQAKRDILEKEGYVKKDITKETPKEKEPVDEMKEFIITDEELEKLERELSPNKVKKVLKSKTEDCIDNDYEMENSLIIVEDNAGELKDKHLIKCLNRMILKTRHINCSWIFTLQSYYMFPKILRKQMNYITIFKPKNVEEWNSIAKEVFGISKDKQQELYDYCFNEQYQHLDLDLRTSRMFKNFNELLIK